MKFSAGNASKVKTLELDDDGVLLLDQTALPGSVRYVLVRTPEEMGEAIRSMIVRGAPAIGIAGAYGLVLAARQALANHESLLPLDPLAWEAIKQKLFDVADRLAETRPTAVNLVWALNRMRQLITQAETPSDLLRSLTEGTLALHQADIESNHRLAEFGADLVPPGGRILTHCNAGALATAGHGTALGIVRTAFARDPSIEVFADETRPRFQGAKLTAWEMVQEGIPVTVLTDSMSGSLMRAGCVDMVIVGADRIAANGDTANKIGTYNLALVAHAHHIPFYVAAPTSTLDLTLTSGDDIPIEQRPAEEVAQIHGQAICPDGVRFYNPSFDVTPAEYISAIITEKGIARADYCQSLRFTS